MAYNNFRGAKPITYGSEHRKARTQAFALLPEYSPCCRCHKPMWKWAKDKHGKSALHYDHTPDRTGYLGFSCAQCNVKAGAAAGGKKAQANARKRTRWHSRTW